MWIISKDGRSISNTDLITTIFTGGNGTRIQCDFTNGRGCQLGTYQTGEEAEAAISMLADAIRLENAKTLRMPTDEAAKTRLLRNPDHWHHATGKKVKGRGGS